MTEPISLLTPVATESIYSGPSSNHVSSTSFDALYEAQLAINAEAPEGREPASDQSQRSLGRDESSDPTREDAARQEDRPAPDHAGDRQLSGTPINSTPVDNIGTDSDPVGTIPVNTVPVGTSPRDSVTVDAVPLDTVTVDTIPVDTVPVDTVPIDTIPIDTIPVDTVPADTIPVDTVPVDTVPVDTIPVDTVPVDTVPIDTIPIDTIPIDTIPVDTIPVDTVPVDTIPVDTIPNDTVPVDTVPVDTIPVSVPPADQAPLEPAVVPEITLTTEVASGVTGAVPSVGAKASPIAGTPTVLPTNATNPADTPAPLPEPGATTPPPAVAAAEPSTPQPATQPLPTQAGLPQPGLTQKGQALPEGPEPALVTPKDTAEPAAIETSTKSLQQKQPEADPTPRAGPLPVKPHVREATFAPERANTERATGKTVTNIETRPDINSGGDEEQGGASSGNQQNKGARGLPPGLQTAPAGTNARAAGPSGDSTPAPSQSPGTVGPAGISTENGIANSTVTRTLQSGTARSTANARDIMAQVRLVARPGVKELTLRLKPKELGSLRLQFQLKGDQLRVKVTASSSEVVALLKSDLSAFTSTLKDAGIDVTSLDIGLDQKSAGADPRNDGFSRRLETAESEPQDASVEARMPTSQPQPAPHFGVIDVIA